MMDRRRFLLTSLVGAFTAPLGAGAQQTFSGSCQAIPLTLLELLARHRRQMVLLVIRDLALPTGNTPRR